MEVCEEIKLDFNDVLLVPQQTSLRSRKDVDLERTMIFRGKPWKGIPIYATYMDTSGTMEMARELSKHRMLTALHKYYSVEELQSFFMEEDRSDYIMYTLGIGDEELDKLKQALALGLGSRFRFILFVIANGYIDAFGERLKEIRALCPDHVIMAGTTVTPDGVRHLLSCGADIALVGIGGGSSCTTRKQTGIGYPQLSAVLECSQAAHEMGGFISSDCGIVVNGDLAKAFCAGADFISMGGRFSGFAESGGKLVERNGKKYKEYYGMSSTKAMEKYYNGKPSYRASEGREAEVPFKGSVSPFVEEMLGSLRSTGTYIDAHSLEEFKKKGKFIRVNRQLNTSFQQYTVNG